MSTQHRTETCIETRTEHCAPCFDGWYRVGEAAAFLGVSKETLRNWDKSGRLVPQKNRLTGYRYYRPEDLELFLEQAIAERQS
ncbi:MerR family transcriptional regulator [Rhodopirellula sp. JC740]|uniref:MerR family transcriptional regulator n=1 Tax=Rhodopirellula halodulae TaxID=2894198 RepID=A0ABS8NGU9_9BACT|nr:MerR family DNA-binding transcriptional regulator [Rhodopirellula sp. JC740]MCC9642779.1 MerR family transcriptional regulator [Rhodopirellula sp. JC740]